MPTDGYRFNPLSALLEYRFDFHRKPIVTDPSHETALNQIIASAFSAVREGGQQYLAMLIELNPRIIYAQENTHPHDTLICHAVRHAQLEIFLDLCVALFVHGDNGKLLIDEAVQLACSLNYQNFVEKYQKRFGEPEEESERRVRRRLV